MSNDVDDLVIAKACFFLRILLLMYFSSYSIDEYSHFIGREITTFC